MEQEVRRKSSRTYSLLIVDEHWPDRYFSFNKCPESNKAGVKSDNSNINPNLLLSVPLVLPILKPFSQMLGWVENFEQIHSLIGLLSINDFLL